MLAATAARVTVAYAAARQLTGTTSKTIACLVPQRPARQNRPPRPDSVAGNGRRPRTSAGGRNVGPVTRDSLGPAGPTWRGGSRRAGPPRRPARRACAGPASARPRPARAAASRAPCTGSARPARWPAWCCRWPTRPRAARTRAALWTYKSARSPRRRQAGRALTVLLLVFLREHGPCLAPGGRPARPARRTWPSSRAAAAGLARTRCARWSEPYLRLPWARLAPARRRRPRPGPGPRAVHRAPAGRRPGAAARRHLDHRGQRPVGGDGAARARAPAAVAAVVLGRHLGRDAGLRPAVRRSPPGCVRPAPARARDDLRASGAPG